ncbi:MAG TPA: SIMPL domain-containing protein [Candidatus Acidoferrum sp.]
MNRRLSSLALAVTCLCAASPARAQEQPNAGLTTARLIPRGSLPVQLFGSCAGEIAPSMAIIAGGVAVQGLKPLDTSADLEKQMAAIAKYVEENHGKLILLERVRTLKNPAPYGSSDPGQPFEIIQRLHVELPTSAPVDAILQHLLELGLDRFGETVLSANGHREEAVLYRVADLDSFTHAMEQHCIADAWKTWCSTAAAKDACKTADPPPDLENLTFTARSDEQVLIPGIAATYWTLSSFRGAPRSPSKDLLGNITVHFSGSVSAMYRIPPDEKP